MCGRHDPRFVEKRSAADVQVLRFFQHGRLANKQETKNPMNFKIDTHKNMQQVEKCQIRSSGNASRL